MWMSEASLFRLGHLIQEDHLRPGLVLDLPNGPLRWGSHLAQALTNVEEGSGRR